MTYAQGHDIVRNNFPALYGFSGSFGWLDITKGHKINDVLDYYLSTSSNSEKLEVIREIDLLLKSKYNPLELKSILEFVVFNYYYNSIFSSDEEMLMYIINYLTKKF